MRAEIAVFVLNLSDIIFFWTAPHRSLLLLAATMWSFAYLPLGLSDCNKSYCFWAADD